MTLIKPHGEDTVVEAKAMRGAVTHPRLHCGESSEIPDVSRVWRDQAITLSDSCTLLDITHHITHVAG